MRLLVLLFALGLAGPALAQTTDAPEGPLDPFVVLVQGDTLRGDVSIREPFLRTTRVVVDSTEYPLPDVSEVQTAEANFVVVRLPLHGAELAQRTASGRISLYTKTVTYGSMMVAAGPHGAMMPTGGSSSAFDYIRVGDGPPQAATLANLRTAMLDDPEATAILKRRQTLRYVQYGLIAGGLAAVLVGAARSSEDRASPLVFVGVGVAVGSWIPHLAQKPLLREAIDTNNR